MVERSVLETVRTYLEAVRAEGISVERAIVFGSQVKGTANEWSDIDLVVVSAAFDGPSAESAVDTLWMARVATRGHIEPIGCGIQRWEKDDGSPLLAIVREEGVEVFGPSAVATSGSLSVRPSERNLQP